MLPKAKHWKSLSQHLFTYPVVKAFVVAFAISALNLSKEQLKSLDTSELFLASFLLAWCGYIFTYSLKSKTYHFYEEGQFNYIHSQNVVLKSTRKTTTTFGYRLEFEVAFFSEMDSVPTFEITGVNAQKGVVVGEVANRFTDRKRAAFDVEVEVSPHVDPEMSVAVVNYRADATDSTLPAWFKWIYRKFPGKRH